MTTKTPSQPPVRSAPAGSAKAIQRRIAALLTQRRWLLVSVGTVGGLLAVTVLLIAAPGSGTKSTVQPQADNATALSAQPDSSGVAVIPGSQATAAMPSGSASAAKSAATSKPSAKATTTAGAKLAPTASASKGAVAAAGTTVSAPKVTGGTITTGNSKANCVNASFPSGVLTQSVLDGISSSTGVVYNCINTFANPAASWAIWEAPWMFSTASDGYDAWLAASSSHQMVMAIDLIPQAVSNVSNPLAWEQPCANGDYNQYATTLAQNLVSYGAGGIVIRLAPEANGDWETDYVGTTSAETAAWAKCYANEVTAMRAVSGARFLFVWNPNICTANIALSQWYPGNSYVDIVGADAYDKDCLTLKSVGQEGWQAYSTDGYGAGDFPSLANIESFAAAHGKPMAIPEWGLYQGNDDPTYVTDLINMFKSGNFAYESYYNTGNEGIAQLGSSVPQATAAYAAAFK